MAELSASAGSAKGFSTPNQIEDMDSNSVESNYNLLLAGFNDKIEGHNN
jgi:hypothetical protein